MEKLKTPLPDSEQSTQTIENNKEEIVEIPVTPETAPSVSEISVREQIMSKLDKVKNDEQRQGEIITDTSQKVEDLRRGLGMDTGSEIPSIEGNKQKVRLLEEERIELEKQLKTVLSADVSENYADVIKEVKESKIDWANSEELGRRLKLKGATDEDVTQVREWLVGNATNAKTFVLPSSKFSEVVDVLNQMTGEDNLKQGEAFHVPGGRTDVPEHIKSSVFMQEKPALPPLPGQEISKPTIDSGILHHEYGHVTQDGLLQSELYKDYNPKIKEGAPDAAYVGDITETDTRIRSIFNNLKDVFDPKKEKFTETQLSLLKKKRDSGTLSRDVIDLLDHYDDEQIIELANTMPAI
ncbi:MAG: hypothetical protein WCK48_03195 [bacterium]